MWFNLWNKFYKSLSMAPVLGFVWEETEVPTC